MLVDEPVAAEEVSEPVEEAADESVDESVALAEELSVEPPAAVKQLESAM